MSPGETTVADEVAAELAELADLLEALPPSAWDAPSLCPGWRVREVVAHLTLPMHASAPVIVLGLLRARFRWNVLADRRARLDARQTREHLLAALRATRMQAWTPPGGGRTGALVHAVIHGLDITQALDLDRHPPAARMRLALDGLTAQRSLSHFGVSLNGLRLHAEDLDWSHGKGRIVTAPATVLALILSGRQPASLDAGQAASPVAACPLVGRERAQGPSCSFSPHLHASRCPGVVLAGTDAKLLLESTTPGPTDRRPGMLGFTGAA